MSGNVLLVAHAGVNRIILGHVLKKPLKDLFDIPQDYAALNRIEYQQGRPVVVGVNQVPL